MQEELNHSTTMQRYLNDNGYSTAIAGKFLNGWPLSEDPPNFDRWAINDPTDEKAQHGYYDSPFNVDGNRVTVSQYSTDYISDRAVDFIEDFEAHDDRP